MMKFIRATIFGFGKWVDKDIDFTDEPIICFYGENESGKTTMQQFIMYVLFGLPPRKLALYQPIHSHKIGGRLYVENHEYGPFTIERVEQKLICYLKNGEEKDETWLQAVLKGLNRQVFESIYAFSALDLVKIKQMKQSDMSNVLFSVGLTGSTTIYEAEKNLDKKLSALYKKTGTKPIINQQITETKQAHQYTIEAQKKEAVYQDKQTTLARTRDEKEKRENEAANLQATLVKKEKHQTFLPQLQQYHEYKKQLDSIPTKQSFPENGVSRLEKIKAKLLPIQSDLQAMNHRLQQLQVEKETYEQALYKQQVIDEMNETVRRKPSYEHALEQQQMLKLELQRFCERIEEKLSSIQMTREEIADISLPFHLETEWKNLSQMQQDLLHTEEQQTKQYESLQNRATNLMDDIRSIEEKMLAKEEIEQIENEQQDFVHGTRIEQNHAGNNGWKTKQMNIAKGILIGASIIAIILIILSYIMESLALLIIPFVLFVIALTQFFQTKRVMDAVTTHEREKGQKQLSYDTYTKQQDILQEQHALQSKLEALHTQLEQVEREQSAWQEEHTKFLTKENEWIQAVEDTKQAYTFLSDVELPYWLDLLGILRNIKKEWIEQNHLEQRLAATSQIIQEVEESLAHHATILQMDTPLTFDQIEAIIQEQTTNKRFIAEREEQIQTYDKEMNQLQEEQSLYQKELDALFTVAHVETEDAFLQVANQLTKRQDIELAIGQIKQQLRSMFSEEEIEELIQTDGTAYELESSVETLTNQLNENKQKQVTLDKQITTLELEIKQLEKSDDHSTAIYTQQIAEDTLQQYADEWAVLKIAQEALQQAKINYQENHLQAVLRYTSTFFEELTNGRYHQVYAPTSKKPFQVEGKDHIVYTVNMLSQGTVDQLYIALRLAISIVMSDRYHMPFIIDDAFVHFDDTRTNRMLRILQNWTNEQQIIIFTCKKAIATPLKSVQLT